MVAPRQKHTSAKTSRAQVPALHRALVRAGVWEPYDTNADIGGGKYNLASDFLAEHLVGNVVYDPYNRPRDHNQAAIKVIRSGLTTATLANVLNVIAEPEIRAAAIRLAAEAVAPNRYAYFGIYEGSKSGVAKQTRDGWQENRKLRTFVPEIEPFFEHVTMAVIEGCRAIVASGSLLRSRPT